MFGELQMSISGVKDLDSMIKYLDNEVKTKISRSAHIKASEPLIDSARARINFKSGRLNRSIGYETAKNVPYEAGAIIVGPRRGKGFKGQHGHLLEYGHKTRPKTINKFAMGLVQARTYGSKTGGQPGFVKPYPFMKPALELEKNKVLVMIKFFVADGIEKYVRKKSRVKN